jgi:hypothetical protein
LVEAEWKVAGIAAGVARENTPISIEEDEKVKADEEEEEADAEEEGGRGGGGCQRAGSQIRPLNNLDAGRSFASM